MSFRTAGVAIVSLSAAEWSALGAWLTAAIAVVAGLVAWRQLGEARRLRREQAQPYVAVFMDHSAADPQFMDLIMRNFGRPPPPTWCEQALKAGPFSAKTAELASGS